MIDPGVIKVILGFLGCGGLAGIIYYATTQFRKKPGELIKDLGQKRKQEKIIKITKKQEVIAKQIEVAEKASDESKKKVDKILKKAAVEVNQILKEDNLAKIDQTIEDEWEDL